jgi:hypothetical protein
MLAAQFPGGLQRLAGFVEGVFVIGDGEGLSRADAEGKERRKSASACPRRAHTG